MADPKIRIRRSATPNKVPETSQLQLGELAINTFDGKLYLEQDQTSGSGIATVIAVNPWNVGLGTLAYDTYFTAGNVGVGTTIPTSALTVSGLTSTTNLYVSGGSTFSQITVTGISPDGSDFGTNNYVPLADGTGGWSWQPVSAASGGGGGAITVREEGSTVGTANSISVLNFVGNNITANAVALGIAATITVSDTPTFDSLSVTGVSTFQDNVNVTGNLAVDSNTLFVNSTNNRIGIGTNAPAYQVEIQNTGAHALLVLDRTDGAACFIEGQDTRSAFGSVNETPLALAYNSAAVVLVGASGSITVNPDGDGFTFPTIDGSANEVLQTDGEGNISFTSSVTFSELNVTGVSTLSSAIVGTSVTITSSGLNVTGVVTATSFVGDGSGITNLPGSSASVGISTNTTDQSQLLTFATGYGSTTGLGATDGLVYNPSSGRLGIGSATPAYTLDVVGDINSSTDVKIDGTGVLDTALALAIALG